MDYLTNGEASTTDEASIQKEARKRISYVSRDHKSMVDFVGVIYKNLGHTDYHSNKAIAKEHNLSPDSIKQHLTSCQQYRLLEIKFGTGYKITNVFKTIYLPLNEDEKKSAIIESLKSPETYVQLFKEYENHMLPPLNGLKNHFVRHFHFKEDIAAKAAEIFIDNLREYNLLDSRGVLITATQNKLVDIRTPTILVESPKEEKLISKKEEPAAAEYSKVKVIDILIPFKDGRGQAHLLLPEGYLDEDLDRVARFVEALK